MRVARDVAQIDYEWQTVRATVTHQARTTGYPEALQGRHPVDGR